MTENDQIDYARAIIGIKLIKWEKWGISKNSNIKNRGISKKKRVTSLKMKKSTENESLRFWGISK